MAGRKALGHWRQAQMSETDSDEKTSSTRRDSEASSNEVV